MLGNTPKRSMSDIRNEAKRLDSNPDIPHHTNTFRTGQNYQQNQSRATQSLQQKAQTNQKLSTNPSFKSKLAIGGGIGLLGAGIGIANHLNKSDSNIGEFGKHYDNAFSNLSGIHEDVGAAMGTSVASSSGPMIASGGSTFPTLKDKTPKIDFAQRLKNLKYRRTGK